ncbi:MAG TPA: hypothetical protein VNA57_06770 [Acidimicrobiales bacterium]|nr:hypothetical protein [Acidimicrobiales bacterium]
MARVRISTTVDAEQLARCRRLAGLTTSRLVDRALRVLADELEREREVAALERLPYEDDPDLSWEAPLGPDLPYDGEVPDGVRRLAAARRRRADR